MPRMGGEPITYYKSEVKEKLMKIKEDRLKCLVKLSELRRDKKHWENILNDWTKLIG
jgi:hypothetical protein